MAKRNQKRVSFESGRKAGHSEAIAALRSALALDQMRNCHPGCFAEDLVGDVTKRLGTSSVTEIDDEPKSKLILARNALALLYVGVMDSAPKEQLLLLIQDVCHRTRDGRDA
jgi:hypothetical protein